MEDEGKHRRGKREKEEREEEEEEEGSWKPRGEVERGKENGEEKGWKEGKRVVVKYDHIEAECMSLFGRKRGRGRAGEGRQAGRQGTRGGKGVNRSERVWGLSETGGKQKWKWNEIK